MTHLLVTYKDLAKFLHPFNNTIYIYIYIYILTLNSSNKKKTIIELIIRNNDI